LKKDWQDAQSDLLLLQSELQKRTESETSLAAQVSSLATQLSNASIVNGQTTQTLLGRVQSLDDERKTLRFSIHILSRKLYQVSDQLKLMSADQLRLIADAKFQEGQAREAAQAHSEIVVQLKDQDAWLDKIMQERALLQQEVDRQDAEMKQNHEARQDMLKVVQQHAEHLEKNTLERLAFLETTTDIQTQLSGVMGSVVAELPKNKSEEVEGMPEDELVDQVIERILSMHDERTVVIDEENPVEDIVSTKMLESLIANEGAIHLEEEKKED
jgi:hypothetical protein